MASLEERYRGFSSVFSHTIIPLLFYIVYSDYRACSRVLMYIFYPKYLGLEGVRHISLCRLVYF